MAERVSDGREADNSHFEIQDESGAIILTVPFETAMSAG